MKNRSQALGRRGEEQAAKYLQSNGYKILEQNYRTPYGEIDIIAKEENVIVFVEVKTRSSRAFGFPEESITQEKKAHLQNSALFYLQDIPMPDSDWRIDVISIRRSNANDTEIVHFENAITGT
jgi:putative endonuclease